MAIRGAVVEALEQRQLLASSTLDTTFNGTGKLIIDGGDGARVADVVVQSDGKILAVMQQANTPSRLYGVYRFNVDGTLDTTYGGGDGIATLPYTAPTTMFPRYDMVLQSDGRVVVAGPSTTTSRYIVARYTSTGILDTTLNNSGSFVIPNMPDNTHLAVQTDGKMLVAYAVNAQPSGSLAMARFHTNGAADLTYGGGDGIASLQLTDPGNFVTDAAVTPGGALLVTGVDGGNDGFVARFSSNGQPDPNFSGDGWFPDFLDDYYAADIVVEETGSIYLAGGSFPAENTFQKPMLAKLTSAGAFDPSFGGTRGYTTGNYRNFFSGLVVEPSGKIVAVGSDGGGDFSAVQHLSNGSPDVSFAPNSVARYDLQGDDFAIRIARAPDGKTIIAGAAKDGTANALIRLNSDVPAIRGTIFNDANMNGVQDTSETLFWGQYVYIDSNNNGLFDAGETEAYSQGTSGFTFYGLADGTYRIRWKPAANYAQTFPTGNAGHVVTVTDGQTVSGLSFGVTSNGTIRGFVYTDNDGDGIREAGDTPIAGRTVIVDNDGDGIADTGEPSAVTDATGAYEVRGVPAGTRNVAIASVKGWKTPAPLTHNVNVTVNGTATAPDLVHAEIVASPYRDTTFNQGAYIYDWANAADAIPLSDGKYLVVATVQGSTVVLRFNANGTGDTTFNNGSYQKSLTNSPSYPARAVMQPDGKLILVEEYDLNGSEVLRYNANFTVDTTFGTNGRLRLAFPEQSYGYTIHDIAVDANGGIYLAGRAVANTFTNGQMAVAKLTSTGAYDSSFGVNGHVILKPGNDERSEAFGIVLQGNKILLAGLRYTSANPWSNTIFKATLLRLDSSGALDTSFGDFATPGISTLQNLYGWKDVALDANGKIVVASSYAGQFHVARFNSNGQIDTTFDTDGIATSAFARPSGLATTSGEVEHLMIDGDGGIVVVGDVDSTANSMSDFAGARFRSNGALDTYFGNGGHVSEGLGVRHENPVATFIDASGGVIVIGNSSYGSSHTFRSMRAVRYNPPVAPPPISTHISTKASYIRNGTYANSNYGSVPEILAKTSNTTGNTRIALIEFDALPKFGTIEKATLEFFARASTSGSITIDLLGIAGTWTESGVTWNNQPGLGSLITRATVNSTTGKWFSFDVAAYLQAQINAGKTAVGFAIRGTSATDPYVIVNSDDAGSNRPRLVVEAPVTIPQGLIVTPSAIQVPENKTQSFTVKLATQPTSNVVVNIARQSGDTDLSAGVSSLVFTPSNWNTAQSVTISAADDTDDTDGQATFAVSSSGLPTQIVTAYESDDDWVPPPVIEPTPYFGTPFVIGSAPVTIQNEHYDKGGEGVAYHDNDASNGGVSFRSGEGVDLKLISGSNYRVNNTFAGEWIRYSVKVVEDRSYDLSFRVSSKGSNGKFFLDVPDAGTAGPVVLVPPTVIPNTGSNDTWTTITRRIYLPAGEYSFRLQLDTNSSYGSIANFDSMTLTPVSTTPPPSGTTTIASNTASYVRGGTYASQNFGSASDLIVKTSPSGTTNTRETYLKFDLSSIASINSAKLQLTGKLNVGGSLGINVYSTTNTSWTETGLTWNNKPSATSSRGSFTMSGTSNSLYELDLTSFLQSEFAAGRKVVTLVLKANTSDTQAIFASDETGTGPKIVAG